MTTLSRRQFPIRGAATTNASMERYGKGSSDDVIEFRLAIPRRWVWSAIALTLWIALLVFVARAQPECFAPSYEDDCTTQHQWRWDDSDRHYAKPPPPR